MKKDDLKDKSLQNIFAGMDREEMPFELNKRIMLGVQKIQKKREWRNFTTLSLFSVILVGVTFFAVSYFTPVNLSGMFRHVFSSVDFRSLSGASFYILIAGIVAILLLLDHRLRKIVKNKKE